jgi:methionine synthase II (cobalamin-independent)
MEKLCWVSTVVGSFPYSNTPFNMEKAFWDEINAGVDYPCYPQLVDMVSQFLDPLCNLNCGLTHAGKIYQIQEDFIPPTNPFATEYGQFVLDFFQKYPETKSKIKGWKACLTGPFTLAGDILIPQILSEGKSPIIYQEPRAIMSESLLFKLASMMAIIAKAYSDLGAEIISMDEPTLSILVGKRKTLFHTDEKIIEILNTAIAPISKYSSIHICGRLSPRLRDILLSSNVKILDHEFTKGDNEGVFERQMFEREDKILAVGAIQSSVPFQKNGTVDSYVENLDLIKQRILKAKSEYGSENVIFKPDCGFGGLLASFGPELAPEIVRRKLSRLTQVLKELK